MNLTEGKIPNEILKSEILDGLISTRAEVIIPPGVGEDCTALLFGDECCILTTDPITGALNDVGRLSVYVTTNDIASCGVEPIGIMITILAPAGSTIEEIKSIMNQVNETCQKVHVDVIGGHTEITSAVNRYVLSATAIGKCKASRIIKTGGANAGDHLIMTKAAALEGTSIIVKDRRDILKNILTAAQFDEANNYMEEISVIKEGVISAQHGATSMHDVTEGGILGAAWEMAEASGLGVNVYQERIKIRKATRMVCQYFDIDPLKLISSGCMLIAAPDGEKLVHALAQNHIDAYIIGEFIENNEKVLYNQGKRVSIEQPGADELYKILTNC